MESNDPNQPEVGSLENDASTSPESAVANPGVAENTGKITDTPKAAKSQSIVERITHRVNVYLLLFALLLVVAGVVIFVTWMMSKRQESAKIDNQTLSSDTLKQLATNDVTVGQPKQVLNVQSNAVFAGKVLIRDNLDVAGAIRVGGVLNVPGITVSGNTTLGNTQINKDLTVTGNIATQGQLSVQKALTVGGSGTFSGPLSAPQLTVTNLQLNGNLTLTKHLSVGGATPSRTPGPALGSGGTVAVSGSDIAGSINVNTGSGAGAGCIVSLAFAQKYNATPRVLMTPIGSGASDIGMYITRTTTGLSLCASKTLPSNSSFGFDYFIVE